MNYVYRPSCRHVPWKEEKKEVRERKRLKGDDPSGQGCNCPNFLRTLPAQWCNHSQDLQPQAIRWLKGWSCLLNNPAVSIFLLDQVYLIITIYSPWLHVKNLRRDPNHFELKAPPSVLSGTKLQLLAKNVAAIDFFQSLFPKTVIGKSQEVGLDFIRAPPGREAGWTLPRPRDNSKEIVSVCVLLWPIPSLA